MNVYEISANIDFDDSQQSIIFQLSAVNIAAACQLAVHFLDTITDKTYTIDEITVCE